MEPIADEKPEFRTGEWCELDESWMERSRDEARERIPVYYEDLATQLGLSREEDRQIQALLVEQYAERNLPFNLLCDDFALLRQRRSEANTRHRAALSAALGPQRLAAFDRCSKTLDARAELFLMNWALGFRKLSLSEAQRKALLERLVRPGALMPEREYAEGESAEALRQEIESWMDQNDQLVLAAARGVLDPAQMEAFEEFVADRRENWIRAEFWRAGVKPPPPADD